LNSANEKNQKELKNSRQPFEALVATKEVIKKTETLREKSRSKKQVSSF